MIAIFSDIVLAVQHFVNGEFKGVEMINEIAVRRL
jgi:hypothetical protein